PIHATIRRMRTDKKMPKPWRDSSSGIYYANWRIPKDLQGHYKKQHFQQSLQTKDRREADRLICEVRLAFLNECDRVRREQKLTGRDLTTDLIPYLIQEWLHLMLESDEAARLLGHPPFTENRNEGGYSDLMDQLREDHTANKHPDFL